MRTILITLLMAVAMAAVAGCTASSPVASPTVAVSSPTAQAATPTPGAPPATPVTIKDLSFQPGTVTITRGGTVTWTNGDAVTHTIKFADGESPGLASGGTYSKKFDASGTFDYSCGIHPSMHGTVNVT